MAQRKNFKMTTAQRQNRYFSEGFRKQKVREIEQKLITVAEVSKTYEVTSAAIYKWLHKYSTMKKKKVKMVIEAESDTRKIQLLMERMKELEQIIGQKQILLDYKEKMIELAEEEYQVDIKKKFGSKPSSGFGRKGKSTPTG